MRLTYLIYSLRTINLTVELMNLKYMMNF